MPALGCVSPWLPSKNWKKRLLWGEKVDIRIKERCQDGWWKERFRYDGGDGDLQESVKPAGWWNRILRTWWRLLLGKRSVERQTDRIADNCYSSKIEESFSSWDFIDLHSHRIFKTSTQRQSRTSIFFSVNKWISWTQNAITSQITHTHAL